MSILYQNRSERCHFFQSVNNTYAPHIHRQVELVFALEGDLAVTISHKEYLLKPGDAAVIFPNQLHSLETPAYSIILVCIFDMDFCPGFRGYFENRLPATPVFRQFNLSCHASAGLNGLIGLTGEWPRGLPAPDYILAFAGGYLTLLLTAFFQNMEWMADVPPSDPELEQRLLRYLDLHYTETLSLETLSCEFGVSRFRLSRLFADQLHTSFPRYITSRRLELAAQLLTQTQLSVTQVAMDAGFGSSRTFFREFVRRFGCTPGEYRHYNLSTTADKTFS